MAMTNETGFSNPAAASHEPDSAASRPRAQASIGQLISGMALDTRNLVTSELALAKMVVEPWLAALIVGVVLAIIGAVMVSAGKSKMSASSFTPDRALRAVRRDAETVQRNV